MTKSPNAREGPTFIIDRIFPGIGRIKRASGTTKASVFTKLNAMLSALFEDGKHDILVAIKRKRLTPLQVYDAYRLNRLRTLPTADTLVRLRDALPQWVQSYESSKSHRANLKSAIKHLLSALPADATANDLPEAVRALRKTMRPTPRMYNITKHCASAFAGDQLGRHHEIWRQIAAIKLLEERATRDPQTRTVVDLLKIRRRMNKAWPGAGDMMWTLAVTGMRPKEYWGLEDVGAWIVKPDHVLVGNAKRRQTNRTHRHVPRVDVLPFAPPTTCWYGKFRTLLAEATAGQMVPYDCRRTYAHWLEEARIGETRIRLYLGHGKKTVTDRYLWHSVRPYLAKDARRLKRYIARELRAYRKAHPKPMPATGTQDDVLPFTRDAQGA